MAIFVFLWWVVLLAGCGGDVVICGDGGGAGAGGSGGGGSGEACGGAGGEQGGAGGCGDPCSRARACGQWLDKCGAVHACGPCAGGLACSTPVGAIGEGYCQCGEGGAS